MLCKKCDNRLDKTNKSGHCNRCRDRGGILNSNYKHGLKNHPLYKVWSNIKGRCYNKNIKQYKDYGGRGITICDEWKNNFKVFYDWCLENGWNKVLEIDRKDNDGNYEPDNCRFVTHQENDCNTRLLQSNNTSGYRGVHYNKNTNKYCAYVVYKNKKVLDKTIFKTAKEAAIYRDEFCIKNKFPLPLNFPGLAD